MAPGGPGVKDYAKAFRRRGEIFRRIDAALQEKTPLSEEEK